MASVTGLIAVVILVVFIVGAACGIILIVAAGIRAGENAARSRHRARMAGGATRYDDPQDLEPMTGHRK